MQCLSIVIVDSADTYCVLADCYIRFFCEEEKANIAIGYILLFKISVTQYLIPIHGHGSCMNYK